MDLGLRGKKAIVTGATKGIGRAVVELLAGEGVDIGLCARTPEEAAEVWRRASVIAERSSVPTASSRYLRAAAHQDWRRGYYAAGFDRLDHAGIPA